MKEFLKTRRFKILLVILSLIIGFMVGAARAGLLDTMPKKVISYITTPFNQLTSKISGTASGFFKKYTRADAIYEENQKLKQENQEYKEKLIDFEKYKLENEQLKQYLNLKEENADHVYVSGMVISRDPSDKYHSFTIDRGSLHGVSVGDPVITAHGLVGIINEVNQADSKVITILNPSISIGAYSTQTFDVGIVKGDLEFAVNGNTRMYYIPNESNIQPGNTIVTSGVGGVFPKGIFVGEIKDIHNESNGNSKYAAVEPAVDVSTVKEVMIIIEFTGQGVGEENPDIHKNDNTDETSSDDQNSTVSGNNSSVSGSNSSSASSTQSGSNSSNTSSTQSRASSSNTQSNVNSSNSSNNSAGIEGSDSSAISGVSSVAPSNE